MQRQVMILKASDLRYLWRTYVSKFAGLNTFLLGKAGCATSAQLSANK